jgi:siderophore synthetase component
MIFISIGEVTKLTSFRFDPEEENILAYIDREQSQLADLFLAHLRQGRRGILHRFLQAVLRENIAGLREQATWLEDGRTLQITFSHGAVLTAPVGAHHSLGRFDLGIADVIVQEQGEVGVLDHPAALLDLIAREGIATDEAGEQRLRRFREELQNSAANLALALAGAELRRRQLIAEAEGTGITTAIEWAQQQAGLGSAFSPLAFFEQWVVEGHPLHPGAKIKMGLDVADVIRYSPEWGARPGVALVAVRQEVCRTVSLHGSTASEILAAEHPGLQAHVEHALTEQGLSPADYDWIPLHPWQFDHTLPELYRDAIEKKEIVPLPGYRIRTDALMSFRSLAPLQELGAGKHHIKTCVNVQTTGAVRTISPNSAENGPTLSRILKTIQEREGNFDGNFLILEERVGVYYRPNEERLTDSERMILGKNLASILRENPENHVAPGEISMPGSGLLAESPFSSKAVVVELIERFAREHGISRLEEAAVLFMRRYAEVALPGFLTVMSRYGISLEGHLQNSVAVFRGGTPVRMILRDFGGVRILRERLAKQGLHADFYPGSATVIDDVADMRNKIYYPVFQNHFGELIMAIVRGLGVSERELWQPVADTCRDVFASLKGDPLIGGQAAADEAALFEDKIDLKAMATMRLLGDVTSYTFAKVPNPLAQVTGVKRA